MLNDLEPYHFESDVFCNEIEKVIPELRDLFDFFNVEKIWKMWNFVMFEVENDYYIVHLDSGTIVNYYKNLGRMNTCNKDLSLCDFRKFIKMLRKDIDYYISRHPEDYIFYCEVFKD